jgi:hypothetical protein
MRSKTYRKMNNTAFYYDGSDEQYFAYQNALTSKNEIWKDGMLVAQLDIPCLEITPQEFDAWQGEKLVFKETA